MRAAGQITAGLRRAAGYDLAKYAVRADCGPSYCGAGRAAGQEMTNVRGGAGCGLNCNLRGGLRAQISSPRRALVYTQLQHDTCKTDRDVGPQINIQRKSVLIRYR